ncbi:hypothetical protein TNIN_411501, partial [Trichonephila inaurata madagascariensis]
FYNLEDCETPFHFKNASFPESTIFSRSHGV